MTAIVTMMSLGLFLSLGLPAWAADPGLPADFWQRPIPPQGKPPAWPQPEIDLRPEACGQCHGEQYDAWKQSLHALAYSPGLVGQVPGLGRAKASQSCLRCHAPLSEQLLKPAESWREALSTFAEGSKLSEQSPGILRRSGVSCAVCHVRAWKRFGPPRRNSSDTGAIDAASHGGFVATRAFEQSEFCATCHQFPDTYATEALNGKPLENTLSEWLQSPFSERGQGCQDCHMPGRRHAFKGIHDADMVRSGLRISTALRNNHVVLEMVSHAIGHAFPTYVTPRVVLRARAFASGETKLAEKEWMVQRDVVPTNGGWRELSDTRLWPGERREYSFALPDGTLRARFEVWVDPDHFYVGVYRQLLAGKLMPLARLRIEQALARALASRYLLRADDLAVIGGGGKD